MKHTEILLTPASSRIRIYSICMDPDPSKKEKKCIQILYRTVMSKKSVSNLSDPEHCAACYTFGLIVGIDHRLNMELDLQSLFGLL